MTEAPGVVAGAEGEFAVVEAKVLAPVAVVMAPDVSWSDPYGASGAVAGLCGGLLILRALGCHSQVDPRFQPEILRRS
jgi:hypothetical protein